MARKPRVVIAGQVPPPTGGQNVMIARILEDFRSEHAWETAHLVFRFTPEFKEVRRGGWGKIGEYFAVLLRLARLRAAGPIDVLIYPTGGPHRVPLIRDLLLLPWILFASRKVVLHFHAAGIADRLMAGDPWARCAAALYRLSHAAVVMTAFNRADPAACGMSNIAVIPHRLPDAGERETPPGPPFSKGLRLLYMGHLCPDKGTDHLLAAFARLAAIHPSAVLELAGECLPPWNDGVLRREIERHRLDGRIHLSGLLQGPAKREAFGRADLFVFPSCAPYESFGLVMVEAMMAGLPVLATEWRGNRDVAAGSSGFFWTAALRDDPADLGEALKHACSQAAAFPSMGRENRLAYEKHYLHDGKVDPRWHDLIRVLLNPARDG